MKRNLCLLRRISVLSVLCFCLVFVALSANTRSSAAAQPDCCSSCEVDPYEGDAFIYCRDICCSDSGACFEACLRHVRYCWLSCDYSC